MSAVLSGLRLRFMRERDLRAVCAIEHVLYLYPWSTRIFRKSLEGGHDCRVGEWADRGIHCYGVMSVYGEEAHLMNIAVCPEFQGKGYGRRLLQCMQRLALRRDATQMLLEVRPSNLRALNLYLSMGYRRVGVRRTYYPAPWGNEDAYLLRRFLERDPA